MSVQPRRIRLKPWLLTQVNSGRYPGLQWISPDHRLFQIPWKHATRHTPAAAEEEHTIFKAWAVETGKYQDGVDEPDPAKWKANLRCALNKSREFQLKYDGTKETPVQPYKVYEVCDQGGNADAADDDDEEMPNLMELSLNPRPSDPPLFSCGPHADVRPFRLSSDGTFSPVTPGLPMTPDVQVQCEGGCGQSFVSLPPPAESAPPCPAPMEASSIHDVHNQTHCKYDLLSSVPLTDLELKFQYRGRPMGSLTVSNPQGCRLFFGLLEPTPDQVDLLGPVSLQQVRFPGTGELQSHKQKFYTDALLDAMERGLILELCQQDLYAMRLCQCKVFWSGPGVPPHAGPNPLEREKRIKVFSLNDFLQGLILFHRGEAAAPPPFDLFFCFGEDWPDNKPREKKLIIVQVVPVVARILTEMFSGELSWSTDSIRLQISNPDVKDQTVEQFKELQRLLQNQHIQGPWAAAGP